MKQYLSDRINAMEVSATLGMAAKTRELKAEGKDIIGLSLGEPDFDIPNFIAFIILSSGIPLPPCKTNGIFNTFRNSDNRWKLIFGIPLYKP